MRSRWVAIVALGAMVQVVLPVAARADQTETEEEDEDTDTQAAPEEEEEEESGPRVILRIDRPTARLQQRTMLGWTNICVPPCGAVVDPAGTYRIAGGGAVISPTFQLPRASGDVVVEGKVGSKANKIVGGILIINSLVAAGFSAYVWSVDRWNGGDSRDIGLFGLGVTVLLGVIGVVAVSRSRTSIRVR